MDAHENLTTPWIHNPEELITILNSSPNGLSSDEASHRLDQFGLNALELHSETGPLKLFLSQLNSPIILILLFATVISAFLKDWVDSVIILLIVLGSAGLSFSQEFNADNAAKKLRAQITLKATVIRDGKEQSITAEKLVPGDVVFLSAGSLIPADGVIFSAQDFYVNQSVLTGETYPIEKNSIPTPVSASLAERTNCVFMGTNVRSGSARVIVTQTGIHTAFGQVARHLTNRPPETDFERGLRTFGNFLTEVMVVLVLGVFVINIAFKKPPIDSVLFSIALAVGLTPQLLPAILSINLSKGSQIMAENGVIVRRLSAIENLGAMDVLCTDKTGTLTQGVVQLDGALDINGDRSDMVLFNAYLNAYFETGLSNILDDAITSQMQPDLNGYEKLDEIPYDFVRKRLSIVVRQPSGSILMVTKGALKNILEVCDSIQDGSEMVPFDQTHQTIIQNHFEEWSAQGFRILGVATKKLAECCDGYTRTDEHHMTFIGFLLFFDPPKPDVMDVIKQLNSMGEQLKIITGDNKLVALHVADSIGLEVEGILTGAELAQLSDEALWHVVPRTTLFADVDPNQKEKIIRALQKSGHVVGYMGDGINDAPALHSADVGISVDSAVDVAKEAADFVLLKQDLSVLQKGIVLGRSTFANTLKYIFIATSANFGNMFSMAGASLLLSFLPLLPSQILLTNFLSDFPSMNISRDSVDPEQIQKPRRWDIHFLRNFMVTFGLLSSVFDYLTFGILFFFLKATPEQFRSGWFLESIVSALFILLVVRTQRPVFQSNPARSLTAAVWITAVIAIALPYSPINHLLGFTPLPFTTLLLLFSITGLYVFSAEFIKKSFYKTNHL
jgi:Mg2+-importing ATPase